MAVTYTWKVTDMKVRDEQANRITDPGLPWASEPEPAPE